MNQFYSKIIICSLLLNFILSPIYSQEIKYKYSTIPKELLNNSKAVIRNKEVLFVVKDVHKAYVKVHYAITILNKNGINSSKFIQFSNKFRKIHNISCIIYNEFGNEIKRIKQSEIKDYSAINNATLFDDTRVKYINPKTLTFPFTVEYEYKIDYKGFLNFPQWKIYDDYNISTERTLYKAIIPKNYQLRIKNVNIDLPPKITYHNKYIEYLWDTLFVPSINEEPFNPYEMESLPHIVLAPEYFKIAGFEGNMNSWNNFGKWVNKLLEKENSLPLSTIEQLKEIISESNSTTDKIRLIYNYMQNKTRYVSIQIGIGGWKPYDANTVDRLCYGDCKALTNYTKFLLDAIGIKSYYTLVAAGKKAPEINKNFPSNIFNHVILCIPFENQDTVWLECTNQNIPFGYL
ncbi:MAG: DUF3857 domain-containing protein, partial [Chlorobi bacterium]|nr:DUF3857 domain-containing protein [Chlorobiota bacterium]